MHCHQFTHRPVRPATNWKGDNFLGAYAPSTTKRHRPVDLDAHDRLRERISDRPPEAR
jgi:hypothetical protein